MGWTGRHIISIADFGRDDVLHILNTAAELAQHPDPGLLAGRVIATLFFEPSTRTRLSFEAAAARLGAKVIGFSSAGTTSAKKGETLTDTIRMVEQYGDCIAMRHPRDGAARLAAQVSKVPVINGGDGANQHPTQTFLDLYTITQLFPGRLEGEGEPLTVAFAGDLRYGRTVHSLLSALSLFNVRIVTAAVPGLEMPEHHVSEARERGIEVTPVDDLPSAVRSVDVLYMTRLQEERFPDPIEFEHVKADYRIDARMLEGAQPQLRILHPLPRDNEIATDVDDTVHAHYFAQAGNGIPVRQALLALVLGARQ